MTVEACQAIFTKEVVDARTSAEPSIDILLTFQNGEAHELGEYSYKIDHIEIHHREKYIKLVNEEGNTVHIDISSIVVITLRKAQK